MKILLIEDDQSLFQEISDRLAKWSFQVFGIDHFANVMTEYAEIQPDLVVIDIQLPLFVVY